MKVKTSDLSSIISEQVNAFMENSGEDWDSAKDQFEAFLTQIEPEMEEASVSEDPNALNFIQDRISGRLARLGLPALANQRGQITNTAVTVLRTAMKLGFSVVLA